MLGLRIEFLPRAQRSMKDLLGLVCCCIDEGRKERNVVVILVEETPSEVVCNANIRNTPVRPEVQL